MIELLSNTNSPIEGTLQNTLVVLINIDPSPILAIVNPHLVIHADAGNVFEELNQQISHPLQATMLPYSLTHCEPLKPMSETSLWPSEVIPIIQDYLKTTRHLLFDAGNCAATALHYLAIPRQTSTLGFGGMGYAIAASIGATLGDNMGHTTVICGDGSFLMVGMEIHTAVAYALPILFIVFNNSGHGMCKTRQQLFFDSRLECSLYQPFDAAKLAQSFAPKDALWTGHASSKDDVRKLLFDYFSKNSHLPGVTDIEVSSDEIPPFAPFLAVTKRSE